jgi:hypothetical protein
MDRILVRSAAVRIFFAVLVLLVSVAATAQAAPGGAPVDGRDARVAAALFTPTRTDDGLEWSVHWVLAPDAAEDIAQGATRLVRFAVPLTAAETIETTWGVAPLTEAGQVVGVLVDRTGTDGRLVSITLHQRVAHDGSLGVHVGAPVAAGSALQIIDGDLGAGARLAIDAGRVLERRVGYVAPPGVSHAAREEARRLTGYGGGVSGSAIYVRGDDVKTMSGLIATVETPHARKQRGAIGIALAFAALVIALFVAVRRLRHAASVERADAILAAEVDALGAPGEGSR